MAADIAAEGSAPERAALMVINAGSSSLKFSVFAADDLVLQLHGQIEGLGPAGHAHAHARAADDGPVLDHRWPEGLAVQHDEGMRLLLDALPSMMQGLRLVAVGHRVVHGGQRFKAPVLLDDAIQRALGKLVPLAPLHQPHNLAAVHALQRLMPGLPQVACFDTAFHADNPDVARRFALPRALHDAGVMRYGFHGLSYEYIASRLPLIDARAARGRTVVLHLGNGASMCALRGGVSVASTMGFTALDGLPMGTRCGNIDPGVLLWLMDERGMDARQIEHLLYSESGLLGVSGVSSDMRVLLASDTDEARQAIELYAYRIGRELGSLAAALGGLDAIVFTAGIGENAPAIRARVCQGASWLGVAVDAAANRVSGLPDGQHLRISPPGAGCAAWVVPTNEELMIAMHARRLVLGA